MRRRHQRRDPLEPRLPVRACVEQQRDEQYAWYYPVRRAAIHSAFNAGTPKRRLPFALLRFVAEQTRGAALLFIRLGRR